MKNILTILFVFILQYLSAQLSVQKGFTAQQLGNNLAGANITILNPVITGDADQYGLFTFNGNNLGLNSGVILSTGDIDDAVGPNSDNGTTTAYGLPGDSDLSALAGFGTNDAVVFEFEFEVQGDALEFNFVFMSEEYNEYVNTGFNDVFAFYISGPGIIGQENLAVVPGTATPVTINSINNNSFFQFYVDNDNGFSSPVNIEFDGLTTLMKAERNNLIPCGVYKLSLRIADGSDDRFDSAVLLQENSLVSNSVAVTSSTISTDTTALEGCYPATYTFNLGATASSDLNIPIILAGTALNGVDYEFIDSIITIPAGQTSSTVIINAFADGITEGRETIELIYNPSSCAPADTVVLYIDDATSINFNATGTDLSCNSDGSGEIDFNISGGAPPYTITYTDTATGISSSISAANLPITGLSASTYLLSVEDQYGCTADALVLGGSFNAGQTFLPDGTGASYTSDIPISGFNSGAVLNNISQINSICATMEHSYASDLTIELIAPSGQTIQLKNVGTTGSGVNTCDMGEPIASGPVDNWSFSNTNPGVGYQYCWTNNPTFPRMNDMISPLPPGPPPIHTFTTLAGNSYTDYYLPPGSYAPRQSFLGLVGTPLNGIWTLKVTDNFSQDNGYIFDWAISLKADLADSIVTLIEPIAPIVSSSSLDPSCGNADGALDITVNGAHPPFGFVWSNGATTEDISGLNAGSYVVSITDTTQCTYTYQYNLSNSGSVALTAVLNDENCFQQNDASIDLSTTAGTFSFTWSNGATSEDLNNLSPGTYTVTVTDGSCVAIESYQLVAALPIVINETITNENCGDQEGIINLGIQGGNGPYTFNWSTGSTLSMIEDLQQGTYSVSVTDANNCIKTDSFVVINLVGNCIPSCDLGITSSILADEFCGDGNGSIDITTFSTSGPISYQWSNGNNSEDLSALVAGTYVLTLTDALGCLDTFNYVINNQTSGLVVNALNPTDEYCGNAQGAIDAVISGGALPYTYNWSNGANTEDLTGLAAGSYTLTVTDANGCSYVNTVVLSNNTAGFVQTYGNAVDEVCSNGAGSIDIIFSGGQQPYSYQWSNGAFTEDLIGISAGTYTCTVTDNGGCVIVTPSYVVNNNSGGFVFTNVDVDDETCANGQGDITVNVTGGVQPYSYLWNTGATTSVISGLNAGIYSATLTDNAGCSLFTGDLSLVNNSGTLQLAGVQSYDEICGNATGSINIDINGNVGPLTYQWSNNSVSEDLTNLPAGNYSCTITDSIGCVVYASSQIVNDAGALNVDNTIVQDENCGQQDGTIDILYSGASAPVQFSWSSGQTTQNLSNVSAGNYILTITDAIGCTVSNSVNLQNNSGDLSVDNQVVTNELCGDGQGSVDLTVSGSALPLSFVWSNGATTEDLSALIAGTYSCTISDTLNCVILATVNINNTNTNIVLGNHIVSDELCSNGLGSIDLNVSSLGGPLTFLWSNGATTEDLNGLSSGSYSCTITDSVSCQQVLNFGINNDPGTLSLSNVSINDENCSDASGSIDINVAGGSPVYNYNWSNGTTTEDLSGLVQGVYILTLTDNNNCSQIYNFNVNNSSPGFSMAAVNVINETCGDASGSIDLSLSGGQPIFNYQWSNGASTEDISALQSGVYTCTITDLNNCVLLHSSTVLNDPGNLQIITDSLSDAFCGNDDGSIFITAMNGTPTYNYQWSNGATTSNITGLAGGNYTCVITDQQGCQTNYSNSVADLGGNFALNASSIVNDVCDQQVGSITANVGGGGTPYTYSWTANTTNPCCNFTLNMYDLNNNGWGGNPAPFVSVFLNGQLYGTFSVPTGNGNSQESVSIPVCTGDSIALQYSPANQNQNNTYELLDASGQVVFSDGPNPFSAGLAYNDVVNCSFAGQGTNSLSGLGAGNYNLTVTNSYGCVITQTYSIISNNGALNTSLQSLNNENCGQLNGSINLNVSGATQLQYLWSNGSTDLNLSDLAAGIYELTVTDLNNGCTDISNYSILNITNGFEVTDTIITNEVCGNGLGAIDPILNGGIPPYSYAWSNGSVAEELVYLVAGNYTLTLTDSVGCNLVEQYLVENDANGITVQDSVIDETCGNVNGEIYLSISGGIAPYTYQWSNGSNNSFLTSLSAGLYDCTITDNSNCKLVYQYELVNDGGNVQISNANINDAFCGNNNGDITLNVLGGTAPYNFSWSNGETTQDLNNIISGNYAVSITDAQGCSLIDSFEVNSNATFTVTGGSTTPAQCILNSGFIDITVSGGGNYTYQWSNGANTEDIGFLPAGDYTVTVTTNNPFGGPCSVIETFTVINNQSNFSLDSVQVVDEQCLSANGSVTPYLSGGNPGFNYLWSNGSTDQVATGLTAGIYQVTITDSSSCQAFSGAIELYNFNYGFGVSGAQVNDENCGNNQGSIDLEIAGGQAPYSYIWSNGASTQDISGLSASNYLVTITDDQGCQWVEDLFIDNFTNNFSLSANLTDQGCSPNTGSIDLDLFGGNPSFSFNWSSGDTTEDLSAISSGTFSVTVTDLLGCILTDSFNLGITNSVFTNTVQNTAALCGAATGALDLTVSGAIAPYSYLWSNGATTEDISGLISGTYDVTITDAVGCTDVESYLVTDNIGNLGLSAIPTAATCGQSNGGMVLNVSGGTAPYTFIWSTGSTDAFVSNLPGGNYGATITDAAGCNLVIPALIPNIGDPVNLLNVDSIGSSCGLCSDGQIDLSLDPAAGPYNFVWSNNSNSEDLINVLPGNYSVTITNALGCTLDTTFTVNISTGILSILDNGTKMYPNPASQHVILEFNQSIYESMDIQFFNNIGQLILQRTFEGNGDKMLEISLQSVPAGVYIVKLSIGGSTFIEKLTILKF